jgi:hypothetical protein
MTPPNPVTRDGAKRAAQHELSKPIYHRNGEPLPVRAVRAVGHAIDHVLSKALDQAPAGSFGALALVVVIVVVVVLVIWRVGVPRRAAAAGGVVFATGRPVSAAEHRLLAERAANAADWHTAVVERMRAIARELEERSVLEARAGRTATELAREGGRLLPAAASELRTAADTFNGVAYGGGEAVRATLELMVTADDAVRNSSRSQVLAR